MGRACQIRVTGGALIKSGTGFVVSPSWILTAAHVVEGFGGPIQVSVQFPGYPALYCPTFIPFPPRLAAQNPGTDVVLLQTPPNAVGNRAGIITPQVYDDAFLHDYIDKAYVAVVAGFPQIGPLLAGNGTLAGYTQTTIAHVCDTQPGESGAPLLHVTSLGAFAPGVHGHGDGDEPGDNGVNIAARFTGQMVNWISATATQYGP